jgi:hypothetical protein
MEKIEEFLSNLDNLIIKEIFTEEDISDIYKTINNADDSNKRIVPALGHKSYSVNFKQEILNKLELVVQNIYGKNWILRDYQFARYSFESKYVSKLPPHFDAIFSSHRLTLDVQLFGTRPWPLFIEGRERILENNQALIFSGTSQIHWREDLKLKRDDRFDMIFCHFHNINESESLVTEEWRNYMNKKKVEWVDKIKIIQKPIRLTNE